MAVTSVNTCNDCAIRAYSYGIDSARPFGQLEPLLFLPSLGIPQECDGGLSDLPGHRQGSIRRNRKCSDVISVVVVVIRDFLRPQVCLPATEELLSVRYGVKDHSESCCHVNSLTGCIEIDVLSGVLTAVSVHIL